MFIFCSGILTWHDLFTAQQALGFQTDQDNVCENEHRNTSFKLLSVMLFGLECVSIAILKSETCFNATLWFLMPRRGTADFSGWVLP